MKNNTRLKLFPALLALALGVTPAGRAADWLVDPSSFHAKVTTNAAANEIALENGLVRRVFKLSPAAATVGLDNLMTGESVLRSVRPEAQVTLAGKKFDVGGLTGQPVQNYLSPEWLAQMKANPAAFQFTGMSLGPTVERFPWKPRTEWISLPVAWPPAGIALTLNFAAPAGLEGVTAEVHYELYDGIPVMAKWVVLHNRSGRTLTLDAFKSEILAVDETAPKVDRGAPREWRVMGTTNLPPKNYAEAPREYIDRFTQLFVVTDYAMGGDMEAMKDNPGVRWVHDPLYRTGIQYYGQFKPCLLECTPSVGPGLALTNGADWQSFRAFELLQDSTEQERRGLAERKMWRVLAPWTQENPIYMHGRTAKPADVKLAVDQCAAAGFEMNILTFGSGFNVENTNAGYVAELKELADYAAARHVALGGYDLLASRGVPEAAQAISQLTGRPAGEKDGARFGASPCLATDWGAEHFRRIRNLYATAGLTVLENDGSYPGDFCAATNHSGHLGYADSQWRQWEDIRDLYRWCRGNGIYLTVPDWHFLNGSSKTAMGYVENNWSLPRAEQEIIERQNIYDGTWEKTPSMGWMFVPLTQYHGGGAAATIEPLKEHLPHYETRLADLFGAGVMASYRGPRLFDTPETEAVVKRWVDFYKAHRAILDSDIIHLRRPDGQDWDGLLHVNPALPECGLAVIYNPLEEPIQRQIKLPLYYTGLTDQAVVRWEDGRTEAVMLARDYSVMLTVKVPARGRVWFTVGK